MIRVTGVISNKTLGVYANDSLHSFLKAINQKLWYEIGRVDEIEEKRFDIVIFVQHSDDCVIEGVNFLGLLYGVRIMVGNKEIMRYITTNEYDTCFISKGAAARRQPNLFFAKATAEYLKEKILLNSSVKYIINIRTELGDKESLFNLKNG